MCRNKGTWWEGAETGHGQFKRVLGGFRFLFVCFWPKVWIYVLLFFQEFTRRVMSR